jgi:glutamate dehydrogenase
MPAGFIEEGGILVIPDVLANSGGVTCSYFEQVQSKTNYYWNRAEVLQKLDVGMTFAFIAVCGCPNANKYPCVMRRI